MNICHLYKLFCFSPPDGPLPRPLHHQSSSSCPHSHSNAPPPQQPPPQGDYVIPHPVLPFHTPLPSHAPGHSVPPAPPPSLPSHHLPGSSAPLSQHLPPEHQALQHHLPVLGPNPVQRLHQHDILQRMEVQRRRLMQHPAWVAYKSLMLTQAAFICSEIKTVVLKNIIKNLK